jgi:signal peptidase I
MTRRIPFFLVSLALTCMAVLSVAPAVAPHVGYDFFAVRSGSMSPSIKTGALAIDKHVPMSEVGALKAGDVITFRRPGMPGLVTHRIYLVGGDVQHPQYTTKGDANGISDSWVVTPDLIVGKKIGSIARLGFLYAFVTTWPVRVGVIGLLILYGFTLRPDEPKNKKPAAALAPEPAP